MPRSSRINRGFAAAVVLVTAALVIILLKRPSGEPEGSEEGPTTGPPAILGTTMEREGARSRSGQREEDARPSRQAFDPGAPPAVREAADFVTRYRSLRSPDDRISLLMDARMLELQDHAAVYDLLLDEATGPDPDIREVARSALHEYGGPQTALAVRLLLESDSQLPERGELEELAAFLELPDRDADR